MSTSPFGPDNKSKPVDASAQTKSTTAERRRRKRAKISAHVHIAEKGCASVFAEVCKSVDVSRDGVLFTSARANYRKGQILEVMFPYSSAPDACNVTESAEVVRVDALPNKTFGVAVQFQRAKEAVRISYKNSVSSVPTAGIREGDSAASRQSKSKVVVLAFEPDVLTSEMIRDVLTPDGYTIQIVRTSEAALEALRTTVPDVFIGEAEGQGISGLDLCLMIRGNEKLRGVPVILVTRNGNPADYSTSQDMGAVMCIAKPFKPDKLLQVVRLVAPPPVQSSAYGARIYGGTVERVI